GLIKYNVFRFNKYHSFRVLIYVMCASNSTIHTTSCPVVPLYPRLTTTTWRPGARGTNLGGSEASTIRSNIGSLLSS
ncbi:hypothetical protein BJ165DRAFT_1511299, partial [Panaeolus papilionaceus]